MTANVTVAFRMAAILLWINAVGFGVFCVPAILNLLKGRDIPYVMGFPAYGKGPFEKVGIPTTVPLLSAFLLECILEGVAGWLLWGGYKTGAVLALALSHHSDFVQLAKPQIDFRGWTHLPTNSDA
jgi:hypothetical protein